MNILFVCLGNICRSPLAEGIMKAKCSSRRLDYIVDSAGTGGWHTGELPDHRSIEKAREYGIDITGQRARQFSFHDFDRFDYIICMDKQNLSDICSLRHDGMDSVTPRIQLMLDYGSSPLQEVPDPYWDDDGFEEVYQLIEQACEDFLSKVST